MEESRRKRKPIELLLVALIVVVVAFLVGANIYYQREETKQKTLFYQLQILRSGVNLFMVVNQRTPANLVELVQGTYKFPGDRSTKKYVNNAPLDKKGEIVDPFGNRYYYDRKTGWVRSATSGYEFW